MSLFANPTVSNPWDEEPEARCKAARAVVIRAHSRTTSLVGEITSLAGDLRSFAADLECISAQLEKCPEDYRKIRPFTVVHLPSIIASLEALADLKKTQGDDDRIAIVEADIKACLHASSQARATLQEGITQALEVDAQVLRQEVDPPDTAKALPEESSGFMGKLSSNALGRMKAIQAPLTNKVADSGRQIATFHKSAAERLDAGTGLAYGYVSGIVEDGIDAITSPISQRVGAIGTALSSASTTAIIGGLVTAIIFPPAIPVAMGLALMDGAGEYDRSMRNAKSDAANQKLSRKKQRSAQAASKIAKLKGKSPVVRIETQHVHVTMNSETGDSQGVILTGKYAGEGMQSLDDKVLAHLAQTAPDEDTAKVILSFKNMKKTAAPTETKQTDPSRDKLGLFALGLDALALAALD